MEASRCAFWDEAAQEENQEWANPLYDLSGFYDSISLVKVGKRCLELGYQPQVLVFTLMMHLAARSMVVGAVCSQPIVAH